MNDKGKNKNSAYWFVYRLIKNTGYGTTNKK
jgi:hypothetical protein